MSTVNPRNGVGRPPSVVILQWLAYFDGLLAIIGGILFLALRNDDAILFEELFGLVLVNIHA